MLVNVANLQQINQMIGLSQQEYNFCKRFVIKCFNYYGIEIKFKGKGINEIGYVTK